MSAERSTESMIDLLYGELSEEEAAEMREELAESAERRAELAGYEDLLGRVRESMPSEDVPSSIHASIMEAARIAAEQAPDERIARRAPQAGDGGIWSRFGRGQGSQIALVAAVLIAGLFVVKIVDRGSSPTRVSAADVSQMAEPAPAMFAEKAPAAPAEEAEEFGDGTIGDKLAEGGAIADQWSPDEKPAEPAAAPADGDDIERSLRNELAKSDALGRRDAPAKPATKAPAPKPAQTRARSSAPSKKSAGFELEAALGGAEDDGVLAKREAKAKDSDDDGRGQYALDMLSGGKAGMDAPAAAAEPAPEPVAQELADKEQSYRAPNNTISAVNSYFRQNDYTGAIRAADEFLATNRQAPTAEKARAVHVKAQSLVKLGRYSEADRLYESLQKNYPGYEPESVNNAREELKRRNAPKRAQKKSKPKADAPEEKSMPSSMDSAY